MGTNQAINIIQSVD